MVPAASTSLKRMLESKQWFLMHVSTMKHVSVPDTVKCKFYSEFIENLVCLKTKEEEIFSHRNVFFKILSFVSIVVILPPC